MNEATTRVQEAALPDEARKLRSDLIETSAKAGAAPDLIQAAMNIPAADVERVMRQLRGEKPPTRGRAAVA